ncbi:MAG: DsrE family protein [Chloroflexi bacterium]|nr:DsrE family protein [Chloroflexota bacterium]
MAKTLCINMLSGYQETDDPLFMVNLAATALKKGYGVKIFLYGNGCNMANQEKPIEGHLAIVERLKAHMDIGKIGGKLDELAQQGAQIETCHTTEYGRGTEAEPYREGVKWGDVGQSFVGQLMTSHVLITLSRG